MAHMVSTCRQARGQNGLLYLEHADNLPHMLWTGTVGEQLWTIWHTCYEKVGEHADTSAYMLWTGR